MKLTCVTAVFNAIKAGNRERLIRCVKSVATLKTEHEHLIYDGASTDGSAELLRELAAEIPGLKVVSERDTGLYNALNKGMRDARGEWFYVLGCDDYLQAPENLDAILAEAPKADLIASPTWIDRGQGLLTGYWKRRRFFTGMPYSHQGTLMRTETMREFGGFDERYRVAGDYDLVIKFHINGKRIVYAGKAYGVFTSGPDSLTASAGSEANTARDAFINNFGLKGEAAEAYRLRLQLPWGFLLRMLVHRDGTIRLGALSMIVCKLLGRGRLVK